MLLPVTLFLGIVHLAVIISCKPLKRWEDLVVKHSWIEIPGGWEYKEPAPADYVFELKIGVKQHRIDELIANLMEISDPEQSRYANHLTREQVEQLTAPHPDSIRGIDEWLAFHGINPSDNSPRRSKAGDWVTVRVTIQQAERMLGTKYHVYEHGVSGDQVVRTLSYSIPEDLLSHIDVVAPTTYFGTLQSMKTTSFLKPETSLKGGIQSSSASLLDCVPFVTPDCLRSMYNTDNYVPQKMTNKLGVAGYLDQFANYADLQIFFENFRPDAVGSTFTTVLVHDGRNDQKTPGIEANLDIQYTAGLVYPTPIIYYSTGGSPPFKNDSFTPFNTNEPYVDFLDYLLSRGDIPQVLTTSYGDDEQTVPRDYAIRVCNGFAALGVRGTTVFFSSGDQGVGGGDCQTNDGKNQMLFQPAFPASCPYVTAVGGTTGNPEVAAGFSGGGFSRYFSRPTYQSADVNAFLTKLGKTYQGMYNPGGRAYPDLSAQSDNFQVIVNGFPTSVGGTSASSPTVASIFSLLNDLRLSVGKSTLGFINPLIYSKAKSKFNDIKSGVNPGCSTIGFTAGTGWDPVTGVGTPDFAKLRNLTIALP